MILEKRKCYIHCCINRKKGCGMTKLLRYSQYVQDFMRHLRAMLFPYAGAMIQIEVVEVVSVQDRLVTAFGWDGYVEVYYHISFKLSDRIVTIVRRSPGSLRVGMLVMLTYQVSNHQFCNAINVISVEQNKVTVPVQGE